MIMNKVQMQMKKAKKAGMTPLDVLQMRSIARKEAEKMEKEANEKALLQLLAIPCLILGEDYWKKSAKQRIPKFIEDVASMYESYNMGIITDQDLADALKDMTGIEIEAEWMKGKKE